MSVVQYVTQLPLFKQLVMVRYLFLLSSFFYTLIVKYVYKIICLYLWIFIDKIYMKIYVYAYMLTTIFFLIWCTLHVFTELLGGHYENVGKARESSLVNLNQVEAHSNTSEWKPKKKKKSTFSLC